MFSEEIERTVNWAAGSQYFKLPHEIPMYLKERNSHNILLASYMTVRTNCEEACSTKLLTDIPEEFQAEYRQGSRIAQYNLKTVNDDLSKSLDSCVRRCFGISIH